MASEQFTEKDRELIKEIHVVLVGNKEYKIKGLVDKVHDHEEYVKSDKKFKNIVAGILIGLTMWKDNIVGFITKHIV